MKQSFMVLSRGIFLLICLNSFGQQSNFNRSQLPHSTGSFTIHDGIDSLKGLGRDYSLFFGFSYEYIKAPYILIDSSKNKRLTEVIEDFTRYQVSSGFFISKNWYVGVNVPFDQVTSKPYVPGVPTLNIESLPFSQKTSSLGDVVLMSKFKLTDYSKDWNWTIIPKITFPTGDERSFNTDAGMTYGLYAAWTKYFGKQNRWRVYGNLGFRYAPNSRVKVSPLFKEFNSQQRVELGAGLSYELTKKINSSFEFKGFQSLPFETGQNPIEMTFASSYKITPQVRLYAGIGLEGILGEAYNNDMRYFAGLSFSGIKRKASLAAYEKKKIKENKKLFFSGGNGLAEDYYRLLKNSHVTVHFETSDSSLSTKAAIGLVSFASKVLKNLDAISEVTIEGHTDTRGAHEKNLRISKSRAQNVKDILVLHKVPERIIKIKAVGETDPNSVESDEFGLYKNRRAEVYISGFRN